MHVHILGICGTFMGGLASIASQLGHAVTGSDAGVYPPMSTQLAQQGIPCVEGYDPQQLTDNLECIIIGNALSRGNPCVEAILNQGLAYRSGPQWLAENVLPGRWVLAVAGTHGKTTTASMLAWILEYAGLNPGFLIGGVAENFGYSARVTESPFFVIEADEYDTAFFDKRSKFVHYQPRTLVLNNLEYDHADIFPDLAAIQRQFHHLVRIVPSNGLIIYSQGDQALDEVLQQGCWTPRETFAGAEGQWQQQLNAQGAGFQVQLQQQLQGHVDWAMLGEHNRHNALAAIAAARHAGVPAAIACEALGQFKGVKRRLELRGEVAGIKVYDDFAHHPTAIQRTLAGLREHIGNERLIAVLEPRSNTMRMGVHQQHLAASLQDADSTFIYQDPQQSWTFPARDNTQVFHDITQLQQALQQFLQAGDHVLIMSNGSFGQLHQHLLDSLREQYA